MHSSHFSHLKQDGWKKQERENRLGSFFQASGYASVSFEKRKKCEKYKKNAKIEHRIQYEQVFFPKFFEERIGLIQNRAYVAKNYIYMLI